MTFMTLQTSTTVAAVTTVVVLYKLLDNENVWEVTYFAPRLVKQSRCRQRSSDKDVKFLCKTVHCDWNKLSNR